ncbi:MAG: glutaredoxin family protein [Gammaproteobacteria bacterium]|nr:glutaredoxin family protein [Gammaproteobacteria bacterium]
MTIIHLYTTAGCHLCELAQNLLIDLDCPVQAIEIGDDDTLIAQYGVRIPVLKFSDNSELDWPFTLQDIKAKVQSIPQE